MDKRLFDDAIGEVPPSTVDVEAAIARGRRAARFRQLASPVAAVAGGVLVLTIGIAAALLPGDRGSGPSGGQQSTTEPPPGTGTTETCGLNWTPPADPTAVETAGRLTGVLNAALEPRLPANAPLVSVLAGQTGPPLVFFAEAPSPDGPECAFNSEAMHAMAGITWMGSSSTRFLVAVAPGELSQPLEPWCDNPPGAAYHAECRRSTSQNGDEIVEIVATRGELVVAHGAEVHKTDGTAVTVLVEGGMIADGDPYSPPLSVDQVVEIALAPGLTLFP